MLRGLKKEKVQKKIEWAIYTGLTAWEKTWN